MRQDKKSDGDSSLMLAIALTKKIADLEERKEPKSEEIKLAADMGLAKALETVETAGPLQGEDYDSIIDALEGWQIEPRTLAYDELIAVIHLFKELWLNLVFAQWRNSERLATRVECIGKCALDFEATLLIALTKNTVTLAYPKEVISIERHLLRLYELLTSPTKFSKKASTHKPRRPHLQKRLILGLLKSSSTRPSVRPREKPATLPSLSQLGNQLSGFRPFPLSQEKLLLSSSSKIPTRSDESNVSVPICADEQMYVLPAEQLRIMNAIQRIAEADIKLPQRWINYYLSTLDPKAFETVPPQWTTDKLRTGWDSINVCILVLEQFVYSEGMAEMKAQLAEAYFAWSGKALDALLGLLQDTDISKAEATAHIYSEYMFKLFLFFSYLSKGSPEISLRSAMMTAKMVTRLIEADVKPLMGKKTADAFLSSLYFPFAFMTKQVCSLMLQSEPTNFADDLFMYNFVKIALNAFLFVARAIAGAESSGPATSAAFLGSPKITLQGAIDSLEELTDMLSGLVARGTARVKAYTNGCFNVQTVEALIQVVESQQVLKRAGAGGMVGKLIIGITQKDVCYSSDTWETIVQTIVEYYEKYASDLSSHMLALILKLALCCASQVEQKAFKEEAAKSLSEKWARFLPLLFGQVERGRPQSYMKLLGILLLSHTILKGNSEVALNQAFISSFLQAQNRPALIDGFLRVHSLLAAEGNVLKQCHHLISSILVQGKEPETPPEMVSKADVASGVPKLFVLCEAVEKEEQLLSLESFLSIERDEVNKPLLEKLLQNPRALAYKEELKSVSLNYYLSTMLRLISAKTNFAGLAETLQETLVGCLQCYLRLDCGRGTELSELAYYNAVSEMYIIFLDFHLSSGTVLSNMQNIAELLNRTGDRVLCNVEGLIQSYFATALQGYSESEVLVGMLKDLFLLGGDVAKITQNVGVAGIDVSHLANICQKSTLTAINDRIAQDNMKYANHYQWVVTIIESHMATHTKCKSSSFLHYLEKTILSNVQLMFSLLPLYFRFYSPATPSAKHFMIKLFLKSESFGLPSPLGSSLKSSALEMFRTIEIPAEQYPALHEASLGLLIMNKIAGTLKKSAGMTGSEGVNRATKMLLDRWEIEFSGASKACCESAEVKTYSRDIAGYDFEEAVKDVCQFFESIPVNSEPIAQLVNILLKCADEASGETMIQQYLMRTEQKRLLELIRMKDPDHHMHTLLSKVNPGNPELQRKLFQILAEGVTKGLEDENLAKQNLILLGEIVASNRQDFINTLIEVLMPWVAKCQDKRMQHLMLMYLTWLCYEGMVVKYPRGEKAVDNTAEIVKEAIEGYGMTEFKRNEQPAPKNQYCTATRAKKRLEKQPLYNCYTCGMADSKVCCSVCAKACHKGHNIVYVGSAVGTCECRNEGNCRAQPKKLVLSREEARREYRTYRHYLATNQVRYQPFSRYRDQMRRGRSSYIAHLIERQMRDELDQDNNGSGDEQEDIVQLDVERPSEQPREEEVPEAEGSGSEIAIDYQEASSHSISGSSFEVSAPRNLEEPDSVPEPFSDIPLDLEEVLKSPEKPAEASVEIVCKNEVKGATAEKVWMTLFGIVRDLLSNENKTALDRLIGESLYHAKPRSAGPSMDAQVLVRSCEASMTASICNTTHMLDISAQGQPPRRSRPWMTSDSPSNLKAYLQQMPAARSLVSSNKAGIVAIAERDGVNLFAVGTKAGEGEEGAEKTNPVQVERLTVGFQVCGLHFNADNDSYLAVTGLKDCVVFILDPEKGTQVSKLKVDLMLQSLGEGLNVSKAQWLPGSQTILAIAAHNFVKVYDLARDNLSPLYTLTSCDGTIQDMVIIKESKTEFRFVVCIEENSIGNVVVEIPDENSDGGSNKRDVGGAVEIADTLTYAEPLEPFLADPTVKIVSLHYSVLSGLLFFTLDNGKIVYGATDPSNRTLHSAASITIGEGTKAISSLQDIAMNESYFWLAGLVNNGTQLNPIIVQLGSNTTVVQKIRGRAEDVHVLNEGGKKRRVAVLTDSPTLTLFGTGEWENKAVRPTLTLDGPAIGRVIDRKKLPSTVSMPVDFFEGTIDVASEKSIESNIVLTGSLVKECKKEEGFTSSILSGKRAVPIVVESPASLQIALKDPSYVFSGIRVVADSTCRHTISIFNRRVQTGQNLSQVTDIPFCDAETFSVADSPLQMSFEAEGGEIRLLGIEVYVTPKDKFGYYEKLSKLEASLIEKAPQRFAELSQHAKLTQTKSLETQPWLEKSGQLEKAISDSPTTLALVSVLDFVATVAYSSVHIPADSGKSLLKLLQIYVHLGIEDGIKLQIVRSAVRRCAKGVIFNINRAAKEVDYREYKAEALFEYIETRIKGNVSIQVIERYMLHLNKTAQRSYPALARWLDEKPAVLENIKSALLISMQEEGLADSPDKIRKVLHQYARLAGVYHDYLSGKFPASEDFMLHLSDFLSPFITHSQESIKAACVEALAEQAQRNDSSRKFSCSGFDSNSGEDDISDVSMKDGSSFGSSMLSLVVRIVKAEAKKDAARINAAIILCHQLMKRKGRDKERSLAEFVATLAGLDCTSQGRAAFLMVAMLNQLMEVIEYPEDKKQTGSVVYKIGEENVEGLLRAMLAKEANVTGWMRGTIAKCYESVRAQYSAEDSMAMQDIAGESKAFLKVQRNEAVDCWGFFFGKEVSKKGDLWAHLDEQLMSRLFFLCYNLTACDKIYSAHSKAEGPLSHDPGYSQLVQDVKLYACIMLVTPGIPASLLAASKKVLLILTKSKSELQEYKDSYEYQNGLAALEKFCAGSSDQSAAYRCLQSMWKLASDNSALWKRFVQNHAAAYQTLFRTATLSNSKVSFYAIAMVCLALEPCSPDSFNIKRTLRLFNGSPTGKLSEKAENFWELSLGCTKSISDALPYDEETFNLALGYAAQHLLSSASAENRIACAHLLKGLWDSGTPKQGEVVLGSVLQKVTPGIYRFGAASLQLMYLVLYLIQNQSRSPVITESIIDTFLKILTEGGKEAVRTMQQHENGAIYRYIEKMLGTERGQKSEEGDPEFTCCLDRVPCGICVADVGEKYVMHRLEQIREEVKFTETAYIVRLKDASSIQKIALGADRRSNTRFIKAVNIYTTNAKAADFDELKKNWGLWKKVGTLNAKFEDRNFSFEFPIPVTTRLIMLEFVPGAVSKNSREDLPMPEGIVCPGCNHPVTTMTGICTNCGENAYQCPKCHSINYNKPDAFICTECGSSRYERFEFSLCLGTGLATERIESEKEKAAVQKELSAAMEKAMKLHESIRHDRDRLAAIISSTPVKSAAETCSRRYVDVYSSYTTKCLPDYQKLVQLLKNISGMKTELLIYSNQQSTLQSPESIVPAENCYGCAEAYMETYVRFIEMAAGVGRSADILHKYSVPRLLLSQMLPFASPAVAKRIIKCFVALSLQSGEFANEVFVRAENAGLAIENPGAVERADLVLAVELILQLHSKTLRHVITKKEESTKDQKELLGKTTKEIYKLLAGGVKSAEKRLVCAEEVVQPVLAYVTDLLALLSSSGDVVIGKELAAKLLGEDVFELWPDVMKTNLRTHTVDFIDTWLVGCLLHAECKELRETTEKLLKTLFRLLPASIAPTAVGMIKLLSTIYRSGRDNTSSFMNVLKHIFLTTNTHSATSPSHIDCRWGITELLRHCDQELNRLYEYQQGVRLHEDMLGKELWMGFTLHKSYEIIFELSQQRKDVRIFAPTDKEMVYYIIAGCIKVKRLLVISNNYIEKTQQILDEIFKSLRSDNKEEMRMVVTQCMVILKENSGDEQALAFLYEELHRLVNPEKKQPVYIINLKRASTQEMYIKGTMNKSVYPLSELGIFMSDIRTRICKDIGMSESEELMELLVANQIIGLDLPIKLVYEKIWWPHVFRKRNPEVEDISPVETAHPSQLEPMTVVYRLAGVDGEATENRVENIPEAKAPEDPEKKYALASVFADPGLGEQVSGLEAMLSQLEKVQSLQRQRTIAERLLRLISVAVKTRVCRNKVIEVGGMDVLAEKLIEFLPCYETAEGHIVDTLIMIVGDVISEANMCVTSPTMRSSAKHTGYVQQIVSWFAAMCNKLIANKESIKGMIMRGHAIEPGKYIGALTHILPYFAHGRKDATESLVQYFKDWIRNDYLDLPGDNGGMKQRVTFHSSRIIDIVESVPSHDPLIKDTVLKCGVTLTLSNYINSMLRLSGAELELTLARRSFGLQIACKLLLGLLKSHANTQGLMLEQGMIPLVYRLQLMKFSNPQAKELALLAEMIVEELGRDPKICPKGFECVQSLIARTKEENKQQAARRRAEVLRQLSAKASLTRFNPAIQLPASEDTLKCIVCHEGYSVKSDEILGAYVFTMQCSIRGNDNFEEKYSHAMGFSTVTHFNLIHLSCHQNAFKAERSMRQPKGEWDGATLRNSYTKCNNWLPIRGGNVSDRSYNAAVERYFAGLRGVYKTESPKLRVVAHDIKFLLKKFAYEESFSHHSQGGGPVHNAQLIPFMMQLALYLLASGESNYSVGTIEAALNSFCKKGEELTNRWKDKTPAFANAPPQPLPEESKAEDEAKENELDLSADDLAYVCVLALLGTQYKDWTVLKSKLIPVVMALGMEVVEKQVVTRKRHKRNGEKTIDISETLKGIRIVPSKCVVNELTTVGKVVHEVRPLLILLCLVEELKKLQSSLLGEVEEKKEDLPLKLFQKLSAETGKATDAAVKLDQTYESKLLEFKNVTDFLKFLGVTEESAGLLLDLHKATKASAPVNNN